MSVDDTIRELSGTLTQLGSLVSKINEQIGGISGRINITLQNFDDSVAGIARDANKMTGQVDTKIGQVPGPWAFYLLFFTLIGVLVLLSILIIINLIVKVQSICRILRGESSRTSTPLQSLVQSEFKQPLHGTSGPQGTYVEREPEGARMRHHIAVEMESEPRRYGLPISSHQFPPPSQMPVPCSRATVATTVYHPGQQQIRQMEYYDDEGGGGRHQEGASSGTQELRGRSHHARGSPASGSQPV